VNGWYNTKTHPYDIYTHMGNVPSDANPEVSEVEVDEGLTLSCIEQTSSRHFLHMYLISNIDSTCFHSHSLIGFLSIFLCLGGCSQYEEASED
jgi:hypothetical protein